MDDAIWAAEKAAGKAKLEWQEASVVMAELKLKPALQTFKAWLWASATVIILSHLICLNLKITSSFITVR